MDNPRIVLTTVLLVMGAAGVGAVNTAHQLSDVGKQEPVELEPGDPVNSSITDGSLAAFPTDYYLDVERGRQVTVSVTARNLTATDLGGVVAVTVSGDPLREAGETDASGDFAVDSNETGSVSFVATQAGRVDVRLIPDRVASVDLTVEATVTELDDEPNDDIGNATTVPDDAELSDSIPAGGVDVFAFDASAGDRVRVTFDREPEKGVTAVTVLGPVTGAEVGPISARMVGVPYATEFGFVAPQNATYYVQVADVEQGHGNYTLELSQSS